MLTFQIESTNNSSNSNNNNNNNNDNNDNDNNDNLIDKLLNNSDKLHNFNDKVLNNLIIIAKSKKELSINIKKIRAVFNKIENVPKNGLGPKLDEYKNLNILLDYLMA